MIYIDVTSAAASPVNMGVQRTVRGLYSHLKTGREVVPVRWDFREKCYAQLSAREQNFLNHPFASYQKSTGTPGFLDWRHWLADWKDARSRKERRIEHAVLLAEGNLLLIPDLCWDPRIHAWSGLAAYPGRKVAIFHDAMPLRIPGQADSHDALFAEYVRALAHLDLVICISHEVEDDLRRYWTEYGVTPKPIRMITWPVPFNGEPPENPANQATRKLIYVARLKLRKNHLVLLEACETLWRAGEKFELDLIGIADAFTDTFEILRKVKQLAGQGRPVKWRKHISDAALDRAYRDSSFTVFPSRMEGFGLPIIESLWHRRPVICGSNGAIGEVATGGGCYQVDQNNATELAAAIRLLLSDREVYERLYDEARHRTFRSWDDYGRELEETLQLQTPAVR